MIEYSSMWYSDMLPANKQHNEFFVNNSLYTLPDNQQDYFDILPVNEQ